MRYIAGIAALALLGIGAPSAEAVTRAQSRAIHRADDRHVRREAAREGAFSSVQWGCKHDAESTYSCLDALYFERADGSEYVHDCLFVAYNDLGHLHFRHIRISKREASNWILSDRATI